MINTIKRLAPCLLAPACLLLASPLYGQGANAADWQLILRTEVPSSVAYKGENAGATLHVQNPSGEPASLHLRASAPAQTEEEVTVVELGIEPQQSIPWALSTEQTGYRALSAEIKQGDKTLAATQGALLVLPTPANTGVSPAESFFGTMFIRDAEATARLGVKVERKQAAWAWLQPQKPDTYFWDTMDRVIDNMAEHGIATVLCIRPEIRPSWAEWQSIEELSEPENINAFSDFVTAVVSRYKDKVIAIQIMNEPDLEVVRHSSGKVPATEVYARMLKAGYAASKAAAPELPVLGVGVSGVDFPNLNFSRAVLEEAADSVDILSGHPYAYARYLGQNKRGQSPLQIDTAGRFSSMATLMQAHGIPPRIWSTEFGWALHLDEPLDSPTARQFAATVAQAISIARSVPELEKLFWFAATFPGSEQSSSYGLFRKADEKTNYTKVEGNWYPSPSAAAYATCARLLDDASFAEQFQIGEFTPVLRFHRPDAGEDVFVLWLEGAESIGSSGKLILQETLPEQTFIQDALGVVHNTNAEITIDALPLFISVPTSKADALRRMLGNASIEASSAIVLLHPRPDSADTIRVDVLNNTQQTIPVKLFQTSAAETAESRLLPPGRHVLKASTNFTYNTPQRAHIRLLDETSSRALDTQADFLIRKLPHSSSFADLRNTQPPISLDQRDQVLPNDPGVDWKGAQDLSMQLWAGWNSEGILLLIQVRDDMHSGPPPSQPNLWRYDSVQIAIDTEGVANDGYDSFCHEFTLALNTDNKPVADNPLLQEQKQFNIERSGDLTTYQTLIPWQALHINPLTQGSVIRMNVIANDRDERERKCWIGLSPGIGESKIPSAFNHWILQ